MKELLAKFNIGNPDFMVAALLLCVIIIGYCSWPKSHKTTKEIEVCRIEEQLQFEGVITDYSGSGYKTSPTIFMIGDSIYKVPRYNSEWAIRVGDTIKKIRGEHLYYFKHSSYYIPSDVRFKRLDTVIFNCDTKEQK